MKCQTIFLKWFLGLKGAVYYEAIAMVIFSQVKITCYFLMWRYQVFAQKLTWYFIGVYNNKVDYYYYYNKNIEQNWKYYECWVLFKTHKKINSQWEKNNVF